MKTEEQEIEQMSSPAMTMPSLKEIVKLYVKEVIGGIEKKIDESQGENNERFNALENKVDRNYIEITKQIGETNQRIDRLESKVDQNHAETNQRFDKQQEEFHRELELLRQELRRGMDRNFKLIVALLGLISSATIGTIITVILRLF